MEVELREVDTDQIQLNPNNPRIITEKGMERLIKSINEFPDMMKIREIVVDENLVVLGGNMRLLAIRALGKTRCIAKIVTGTTAEKNEFIIKDNADFGTWNWDDLANKWEGAPLVEWGVKMPEAWGADPFNPALNPQFDQSKVTDDEINKRAKVLAEQMRKEKKLESVMCPECGHEFYIEGDK